MLPSLQDLFNAGWIKVDHEFVPRFVTDGLEYTFQYVRNQQFIGCRKIIKEVHDLQVRLVRGGEEMEVLVRDGKVVSGVKHDLVLV